MEDEKMPTITANEIKRRGIVCIDEALETAPEATISVRGQNRYVVLSMAQYQHLRECELEAALLEVQQLCHPEGARPQKSPDHIARMKNG